MAREGDILDGKYLLRRLLGDGGMGNVFLAENVKLGHKPFAVKTLKPEYLSNKDLVARFLEEALAASRVEHDNIVEVFDADIDAATGTPYIVQRYLRGTNLRAHLDAAPERRLPPGEALDAVVPVMGALVATHKQKIIHRDIKPENIFLVRTSSGNVVPKLIDFGIAKHLDGPIARNVEGPMPTRRSNTRAGAVWGTFDYMSPEQARGDRNIDVRADIWSVGAVLFEVLTGRLPYVVRDHNELVTCFAEGPPPRVDAIDRHCPRDLADAVERALQTDPSKRWPSMAAFISALINCPCYQSTVAWRAIPLSSPDLTGEIPDLSSLARPATEEFALPLSRPSAIASRRPASGEERVAPSTRTLERIVPEPWSARRLLPAAFGVAAVLVGAVIGARLQTTNAAPHVGAPQVMPLRRHDAAVAPALAHAAPAPQPADTQPEAPPAQPAAPPAEAPQPVVAQPEPPPAQPVVAQHVAPTRPARAPRLVAAPTTRPARPARPARARPASAGAPLIQTEF